MVALRSSAVVALASLLAAACARPAPRPQPDRAATALAERAVVNGTDASARVREPGVAGSWYPRNAETLAHLVDGMLADAKVTRVLGGPVRALIAPHAGYEYSGPIAAAAFRLVRGERRGRVIVLGPSHDGSFRGIAVDDYTHYRTPLGDIAVDQAAIERLRRDAHFVGDSVVGAKEHSIEMELPLLQRTLAPGWKLVPLLVGTIDTADAVAIAEAIRPLADDTALVVASGDFTHYGASYGYLPFRNDAALPKRLEQLDLGFFRLAADLDAPGLADYERRTGIDACGYHALLVLANLLAPDVRATLVRYETSGANTGSYDSSVSYVAAAFAGPHAPANAREALPRSDMKALLAVAIRALKRAVRVGAEVDPATARGDLRDGGRLGEAAGSFVTLKKRGELRGCIGTLAATRPVWQSVAANAMAAALRDDRFPTVRPDELRALDVEVSVLSPLKPIPSWRAFRLGADGILLKKGPMSAVFLPEVATEQGWGTEQLLDELSEKAGLPKTAWHSGASFEVFTTQTIEGPVGASP